MEVGLPVCWPFEPLMTFIFCCLWLADWSQYLLIEPMGSNPIKKEYDSALVGGCPANFFCETSRHFTTSHPSPLVPKMSSKPTIIALFIPDRLSDMVMIFVLLNTVIDRSFCVCVCVCVCVLQFQYIFYQSLDNSVKSEKHYYFVNSFILVLSILDDHSAVSTRSSTKTWLKLEIFCGKGKW